MKIPNMCFLIFCWKEKKEFIVCNTHSECPRFFYCDKSFPLFGYCKRQYPQIPILIPNSFL